MYTISLIKMNLPWAKLHLKTEYKVQNIKIQSPQPKKETKLIYAEKMDNSNTTKFNISSNSSITDRDILQQNMTWWKKLYMGHAASQTKAHVIECQTQVDNKMIENQSKQFAGEISLLKYNKRINNLTQFFQGDLDN